MTTVPMRLDDLRTIQTALTECQSLLLHDDAVQAAVACRPVVPSALSDKVHTAWHLVAAAVVDAEVGGG